MVCNMKDGKKMSESKEKQSWVSGKLRAAGKAVWNFAPLRLYLWCLLLVYMIECCGRHSLVGGLQFFMMSPLRYIMNAFLVMTPFTVVYIIRKRSLGYVLISFAWLAIGITNGVVLHFRVTPFSTIDFRLVDAALGVMGNYMEIWQMILVGILAVLAVVLVVFLIVRIRKYEGKMHYVRNVVVIVLYWFAMYYGMKGLVHAGVFSTVLPNLAYAYKDYGVAYCFTVTGMRNGITKPIDYSEVKINDIMDGVNKRFKSEKQGKKVETPNIIFLQLESFFDISHVKEYEFTDNPIPYFTSLKENYSSGYLTVPAFGAGTANTEFEIMTGMNLGFFSPGEYPYKTILKKRTCESAAYDLKSLGYGTHAIHNNTATFYGRSKVFTNLGYDNFSTIETMDAKERTKTGWAKDSILTNEIMDALHSTSEPDYIYTISVQGHGDYYKESAQVEDPEITVQNVSEKEQEDAVNYYVEQIREMDDFLEQLCATLSEFDEDTVLVLYGDHLPGLGFTDEDLDNGDVYQTEYVIWSNFDMKKKDKDLNAYQLTAEVFNRLNIHTGTIMRYHQRYAGKKRYLSRLRALQYDMLYGEQYVYRKQNPYLQTDMTFGVQEVEINSVLASEESAILYGANYTQCSHVEVNGEDVEVEFISNSALRILTKLKDGDRIQVLQETAKEKVLRTSSIFHYTVSDLGKKVTETEPETTTKPDAQTTTEE